MVDSNSHDAYDFIFHLSHISELQEEYLHHISTHSHHSSSLSSAYADSPVPTYIFYMPENTSPPSDQPTPTNPYIINHTINVDLAMQRFFHLFKGIEFFVLGMNSETGKKNVEEAPYLMLVPSSKSKGSKNEEVFEVCRALLCSRM